MKVFKQLVLLIYILYNNFHININKSFNFHNKDMFTKFSFTNSLNYLVPSTSLFFS